jgi:acetolactate synthase-1/2/3 large subunit
MKVADFVINYLGDLGIDRIFVVYGAANGDLIDAFTRTNKTQYVAVMHEQAGGFAAEGYAKIKGKTGVAIATSGPGGQNFVTPIGNCFYDSVPCLFITGQVNTQFLRPDPAIRQVGFQETDIVSIVKPITKYAKMITDAASIKYELEKALYLAYDGRPGPVLLDIPIDIQRSEVNPFLLYGYEYSPFARPYDHVSIDCRLKEYFSDLSRANRPVLMIGGGVRTARAEDELREFSDLLGIPVYPTWNALDIVTSDSRYYGGRIGTYGGAGRNFGIQNSDLLLAIGSRISGRITGGNVHSFARMATKYVVDVDPSLLQPHLQQVPFDWNIYCDAKLFLEKATAAAKERGFPNDRFNQWTNQCVAWRDKYDPVRPEFYSAPIVHPYAFLRLLSECMTERDILVADCGGNIVACNHAFETKRGQRYLTNNGNSPMGFSFAGAMGAWFAAPDRQVVCVIGDGGFNMNLQEMATFLTYGVKVKTFIINNHIYGITKAYQETNFGGRAEACGPVGYRPPDFVAIGNAYGMKTVTVRAGDDWTGKIREVLAFDGPVLCDVDCHEFHTYEPRIFGWKTPIEDMYPYLPRDEFRANMLIEPVPGWETPDMPG